MNVHGFIKSFGIWGGAPSHFRTTNRPTEWDDGLEMYVARLYRANPSDCYNDFFLDVPLLSYEPSAANATTPEGLAGVVRVLACDCALVNNRGIEAWRKMMNAISSNYNAKIYNAARGQTYAAKQFLGEDGYEQLVNLDEVPKLMKAVITDSDFGIFALG
jgi:hypothetical protein